MKKNTLTNEERQRLKALGISVCAITDKDYPALLKNIHDAPEILYYYGTLPPHDMPLVSIVGARRCSAYGRTMAEEIAEQLAKCGVGVVSGMAYGIDSGAHSGALRIKNGYTIAVLGSGVDVCYPAQCREFYEKIKHSGCVISEFPPGTQPKPYHFPMRNRIISGLSSAVIVAEAKEKSGSLITVDLALEQNREVYAVPGRLTDPMSKGCNRLISEGAGIFTDTDTLLSEVFSGATPYEKCDEALLSDLSEYSLEKEELLVYSCLDFYPKSMDILQNDTEMTLLSLISVLSALCEKGLARESFKNQYIRTR